MELVGQALLLEVAVDDVDAVGGHQARPGGALGDEVAQRPADRPRQQDVLAARRHQGELAVEARDGVGASLGEQGAGLLGGQVV